MFPQTLPKWPHFPNGRLFDTQNLLIDLNIHHF